ncbi:hypothetical protein BD779DRAFT_1508788 [Infundibulicybe gibba]|nr:hypothetical protein BD779DRAFT_1508788 [Infundibulicybe gibba]
MLSPRTTLYSFALAGAISSTGTAIACTMSDGIGPYTRSFGGLSAATGLLSAMWIVILILYNKRPLSEHLLTRASAHFISFIVFTPFWFAISIMMASQASYECDTNDEADGWCGSVVTTSVLALTTSILASAAAFLIYRTARRSGFSLRTINIANLDKQPSVGIVPFHSSW